MIVSCGDSFFHGTDLADGKFTWPALVASKLNCDYVCLAKPGCGNLQILQQIVTGHRLYGNQAVFLINWTWIDRFDYIDIADEQWKTARPTNSASEKDHLYFKYFHSDLAHKFQTLIYIQAAITLLQHDKFVMTYMDPLLIDSQWHAPDYITLLQNKIIPYLNDFDGHTFLQWSRANNFPESQHWHPLEQAHQQAAHWWLPKIENL